MTWVTVTSLRRAVLLLPVLAIFLLATACDGFFVSESSIQSVKVTPPAIILMAAPSAAAPGDSFTLTSTATTVGGTQTNDTSTATWSPGSGDSTKITVAAGVVTVAAGETSGGVTATVTARDGGVTSNTVNVFIYTGAVPTSLSLTGTSGTVAPASTSQLKVVLDTSGPDVTCSRK